MSIVRADKPWIGDRRLTELAAAGAGAGKSDQPGNLAAGWLQACSWFLYAISGQPAIQPNVSQRAKGASR